MTRQCSISLITTILLAPICFGNAIDGTPDMLFGSGRNTGQFTFGQGGGVALGLRAKVPYTGELNSDKLVSYFSSTGETWKIDGPVNTDPDGSFALQVNDLTSTDSAPGLETDFLGFDPINPTEEAPFLYQTLGNNKTLNDRGEEATNADKWSSHRQTKKKLTFVVSSMPNLPAVKVWVLFLRVRF